MLFDNPQRSDVRPQESPRAETHTWLTPPHILAALGAFDLDPCACPEPRPWPTAAVHWTREDNSLARAWSGRVWLNPPYGPKQSISPWLGRMAEHNNGTALIFARTETEMFHEFVWNRSAGILFLRGRLTFHRRDGTMPKSDNGSGNAGAPSCLVAYGGTDSERLRTCGLAGKYIPVNSNQPAVSGDLLAIEGVIGSEPLPEPRAGATDAGRNDMRPVRRACHWRHCQTGWRFLSCIRPPRMNARLVGAARGTGEAVAYPNGGAWGPIPARPQSSVRCCGAVAAHNFQPVMNRRLETIPMAHDQMDGSRPLPFDRDQAGRFVREAWVRWARTQPNPKPSWLVPYDDLDEADKEADRQIGEAVARWTLLCDAERAANRDPFMPALEEVS